LKPGKEKKTVEEKAKKNSETIGRAGFTRRADLIEAIGGKRKEREKKKTLAKKKNRGGAFELQVNSCRYPIQFEEKKNSNPGQGNGRKESM